MTPSNIFVCSEKYVALWHILKAKVPRDQLPKVKSKNQLRIRRRMLYLWKLVGCFINYQDLAIHGSLSTICQKFLSLYHLTILWWRAFYHIFLFFESLKNGCKYRFQIWHACKTNKMPSDQHWYEDINIDFDWEFCKNCFSHD